MPNFRKLLPLALAISALTLLGIQEYAFAQRAFEFRPLVERPLVEPRVMRPPEVREWDRSDPSPPMVFPNSQTGTIQRPVLVPETETVTPADPTWGSLRSCHVPPVRCTSECVRPGCSCVGGFCVR